jgi:hypothetical protein
LIRLPVAYAILQAQKNVSGRGFLEKKEYIKVKNENKQLNNAKRQTNYLVCNIENGTVLFVYYWVNRYC